MTACSRSSRRCRCSADQIGPLVLIGLICAGAVAGPAWAQVGEPVQLLPRTTPQYEAPPALPESEASGEPAAPEGFEIDTLDAIGTDYAGTLEPEQGGFGVDMWRGTDRAKVERLLPLLKPSTSPVIADLTRRLLLTNAAAPAGRGSGRNLMPVRARLLGDMGLVEEAVAMLRLIPVDQRDAGSARLLTELSLRAGDPDGACAVVHDSLPRLPVDTFWQQASIFCQLRAGEVDAATLSLDLLREQGESDQIFFALADALAHPGQAELPPLPVVTPLYLAMIRAAGLPVPEIAIYEPPPLVLAIVAESPESPTDARLLAAETAAAAGVLAPRQLAAAYSAAPADAAALDSALDRSDAAVAPEGRAVLYQAALGAELPEQRARLIQKALDADALDPNYWARLRLYRPLLADIPSAPELAWFAEEGARHLFAAGELRAGAQWVPLLPDEAARPRLQALDHLAGNAAQAVPLDAVSDNPVGPQAARLRAIVAAVETSMEPAVPGLQAASLLESPPSALPQQNVNLWLDLGEATAKQRLGETVLLALAGLNATGLAEAEPAWLSRSIRSLHGVGLADEARRLAVEAAILNGL
jgi:hypothetical protein